MNKKIKILFVLSNLRPSNGVASFAMAYFRVLDKNKYQIDFSVLYDYPSPYYKEIKKAGGKVFFLPPIKRTVQHFKACRKILIENNYQIIHDNLLISSLPMMLMSFFYKVPVRILESHNSKLSSVRWKEIRNQLFLPFLKLLVNTYFACGKKAGRAMFKNKNFTVIPNIISDSKFVFDNYERQLLRKKYSCDNKIIIGTVARISKQKNPFFALDVIAVTHKLNPNIEYWWIGSGDLDKEVQCYVSDKGMEGYVRFFGSRNDVNMLYQAMDVFFLPSFFEGLPISAIEAQAVGLPSVVSESITKEIVYTDLVDFVPLNGSLENWAKKIIYQGSRNILRKKYKESLQISQYYAPNAKNKLDAYYTKLISKFLN